MKPTPGAALVCLMGAGILGLCILIRGGETAAIVAEVPAPNVRLVEKGVRMNPAQNEDVLYGVKVTAYCICSICCGKWAQYAKTSTGDDAKICDGVAADPKLIAYRTKLEIPGIGIREVDDTGGGMRQSAKKGIYHIDVRMPSHQQALKWGVRWLKVRILR